MRADETEVLRIATELLDILKYLGSLRPPVIHRDIKPENVILEGGCWRGRVYLVDFGGVQGVTGAGGCLRGWATGRREGRRGSSKGNRDGSGMEKRLLACGDVPGEFVHERVGALQGARWHAPGSTVAV